MTASTKQPLHQIRDYFGSEVAIYFAFIGYYTDNLFYLSVVGCIVTVMQFSFPENNPFLQSVYQYSLVGYSFLTLAWSAMWMKGWDRCLAQLQVEWDCADDNAKLCDRTGFTGVLMKSPLTGLPVPTFTSEMRLKRYAGLELGVQVEKVDRLTNADWGLGCDRG